MREIRCIVLHCTATEYDKDFDVSDVRKWHLKRGFRDVGYHYLVKLDGTVQIGRPIEEIGAHAVAIGDKTNYYNRYGIGIAYVGGLLHNSPFNTLLMHPDQLFSLVDVVHRLCVLYDLDVRSQVLCHSQIANKACPCFSLSWFQSQYILKYF